MRLILIHVPLRPPIRKLLEKLQKLKGAKVCNFVAVTLQIFSIVIFLLIWYDQKNNT